MTHPQQPPWPQPHPGGPQGVQPSNGLALAALLVGLVPCCATAPLAVGLGIAGLSRARTTGTGRGMALAGLLLGAFWLVASAAWFTFAVVGGGDDDGPDPVEATSYSVSDGKVVELSVGACFDQDAYQDSVGAAYTERDCAGPHQLEVYAKHEIDDDAFPGKAGVATQADEICRDAFEDFVGVSYDDSELAMLPLHPDSYDWQLGLRDVVCTVGRLDGTPQTGTLRGTRR